MNELAELPKIDFKRTKYKVEKALERYRLYKYLTFNDREASITSHIDEIGGGKSNLPGDQTAAIAISNAEEQRKRKEYCQLIESAVNGLAKTERFLIEKRYMCEDAEYKTDYKVYNFEFDPPISEKTYAKIRYNAFYKLSLKLNIAVLVEEGE